MVEWEDGIVRKKFKEGNFRARHSLKRVSLRLFILFFSPISGILGGFFSLSFSLDRLEVTGQSNGKPSHNNITSVTFDFLLVKFL